MQPERTEPPSVRSKFPFISTNPPDSAVYRITELLKTGTSGSFDPCYASRNAASQLHLPIGLQRLIRAERGN